MCMYNKRDRKFQLINIYMHCLSSGVFVSEDVYSVFLLWYWKQPCFLSWVQRTEQTKCVLDLTQRLFSQAHSEYEKKIVAGYSRHRFWLLFFMAGDYFPSVVATKRRDNYASIFLSFMEIKLSFLVLMHGDWGGGGSDILSSSLLWICS